MTSDSKGFEKLYPRVLNYLKVEKKNKNEEHEISKKLQNKYIKIALDKARNGRITEL